MTEANYLPEDLLRQIFIRMPTKPLMRLKCLSKQWNRLISDPSFMRTRSRRMIFLPDTPFHAIDNTIISDDVTPSMIKLHFPFGNQESSKSITVVGSFNGIVLLVIKSHRYYDHCMILYNPLSGEFKTIPNPTPSSNSCYAYGFGYGTTVNDLKIFVIRYTNRISAGPGFSSEVFNLKDWSWSRSPLELTHKYIFYSDVGTFANGFLYWLAWSRPPHYPLLIIVVLDIKKMVFSEIEVPDIHLYIDMGTYQGQLCMICYRHNMDGYELRVMNEHEQGFARKSWSVVRSFKWATLMDVLCVLDDGKLLMLMCPSKELVIHDMFKDSYKIVNVLTSFRRVKEIKAVEYVESLISPADICSISVSSSTP